MENQIQMLNLIYMDIVKNGKAYLVGPEEQQFYLLHLYYPYKS